MNYFTECKNKDELKKSFREWAKKLHPDAGGRAEDMVEMQRQYENWKEPSPFGQRQDFGFDTKDAYERMKKAKESYSNPQSGMGGYKYSNQSNMYREFKQQANDPRIADYERMKQDHIYMSQSYSRMLQEKYAFQKEIEDLKKKVQTQKRQLDKLKNPSERPSKKPLKKKTKKSESKISL